MSALLLNTLVLFLVMLACGSLPLVAPQVRRHSRAIFLLGSGALVGICFFDLLPDVYELGGRLALIIAGATWLLYSFLHWLWPDSHSAHGHSSQIDLGLTSFVGSMMAHCLASGILLAASDRLSPAFSKDVFFALLAHKGYESLSVSAILLGSRKSNTVKSLSLIAYAIALPVGVLLALWNGDLLGPRAAMWVSSAAVGALIGCLVQDFMLPGLKSVSRRWSELGWVLVGATLTRLVMFAT